MAPEQRFRQRAVIADQDRAYDHAEQRRGDDRLALLQGQQFIADRDHQDGEAELAGLPERQPGAKRDRQFITRDARQDNDHGPLADDQPGREQADPEPFPKQDRDIQLGAHADKKQSHEHIAEGADIGFDLMLVLGLAEQQPGQKGAERERQPQQIGDPGRRERHEQGGQGEYLGRMARGDLVIIGPEQPAPGLEQDKECQQALGQRQQRRPGQRLPVAECQDGDDHQKRHHGQILKQQHGDRQLPVARLHLQLIAELLGDDGGGRQGQGPARD